MDSELPPANFEIEMLQPKPKTTRKPKTKTKTKLPPKRKSLTMCCPCVLLKLLIAGAACFLLILAANELTNPEKYDGDIYIDGNLSMTIDVSDGVTCMYYVEVANGTFSVSWPGVTQN